MCNAVCNVVCNAAVILQMATYFVRAGVDGPVKIGCVMSEDPVDAEAAVRTRIASLQTAHPDPLTLLRTVEGGVETERFFHKHFAALRVRGEWFTFTAEMLTLAVPPDVEAATKVGRFCRFYVENGGNGKQAALSAGFSPKSAPSYASRLLTDKKIKERIEAIRRAAGVEEEPPPQLSGPNAGNRPPPPPPLNGQVLGRDDPGPRPPPAPMSETERLTRQFLVAEGLRNLAFCMGDQPVTISKITKVEKVTADGLKYEAFVGEKVQVFERDASGANTALAFLDKQLDKLKGEGVDPMGQVSPETRRRVLEAGAADKLKKIREFIPRDQPKEAASP